MFAPRREALHVMSFAFSNSPAVDGRCPRKSVERRLAGAELTRIRLEIRH
jgi:hypothetical protein